MSKLKSKKKLLYHILANQSLYTQSNNYKPYLYSLLINKALSVRIQEDSTPFIPTSKDHQCLLSLLLPVSVRQCSVIEKSGRRELRVMMKYGARVWTSNDISSLDEERVVIYPISVRETALFVLDHLYISFTCIYYLF